MHESFMKLAIKKAMDGYGKTLTNPLVGAVIVSNNQIIATGSHLLFGGHHAEKNAIMSCQFPEKLINSTLYITMEPCHHFGKQPPCTELIVHSGIKKVVIGQSDPNPLVSGKGIAFLKKNGIQVLSGVLEEEVRQINEHYNTFYQKKRPFITLKQAMTLDGKIGFKEKQVQLTQKKTKEFVYKERRKYHGILIGSQTALVDNPRLLADKNSLTQPIKIILDRSGRLKNQLGLTIFKSSLTQVLIFSKVTGWKNLPNHVEIIMQKEVTIATVLNELVNRNIQSLYVEGGSKIHDAFLEADLWDEVITYVTPKLIGGNSVASMSSNRSVNQLIKLRNMSFQQLGEDIRISGRRASTCLQD